MAKVPAGFELEPARPGYEQRPARGCPAVLLRLPGAETGPGPAERSLRALSDAGAVLVPAICIFDY